MISRFRRYSFACGGERRTVTSRGKLEGEVEVGASHLRAGQTAVVGPGDASVRALEPARLLAFGGTGGGARYLWWNYLHSSLDRIEAAKAEWRHGRAKLPDGDTESFTPCPPDDGRPLVRLNRA